MSKFKQAFTRFSTTISRWTGRPMVFVGCCAFVVLWAASGPVFGFSDTWQLVINTSTTIITFLMVFLIQNTQNRDNNAIQAKLDELIRVGRAQNSFIGIENLSDEELEAILKEADKHSTRLRDEARKDGEKQTADAAPAQQKRPAAKRTPAKRPAASAQKKPARRKAAASASA
jgi:low affinity Fe/Cu permease